MSFFNSRHLGIDTCFLSTEITVQINVFKPIYSLKLKNCFHLIKAIVLANMSDCSHVGNYTTCQHRRYKRCGFDPWVRKIPWRRKWQHTPVFLPAESYGQRSLADPIVCRVSESWTSEFACTYICHKHTQARRYILYLHLRFSDFTMKS